MNKFELTCWYCNFSWETNYIGKDDSQCSKCKDTNIKVVDLQRTKIDTYEGSPDFPDDKKNWDF
jgi:Zn finger protein HypA/HybF involved in hydrogenase expression